VTQERACIAQTRDNASAMLIKMISGDAAAAIATG
jgi:hypothetical protein